MRFADFIDKLIEIQNKYDCDDVNVSIMTEIDIDLQTPVFQVQHRVTDIAASVGKNGCSRIIIIGQELD